MSDHERERDEALAVIAEIAAHFVGPADDRKTYAGAAGTCEKIDHLANAALRDIGGFDE